MDFLFYYPLFMSYLWMIGAVYYYLHWEKVEGNYDEVPQLSEYPGVSLVVPCFNESKNVEETIAYLDGQIYPNFEIIARYAQMPVLLPFGRVADLTEIVASPWRFSLTSLWKI